MFYQLYEKFLSWIDKSASLNTFVGLLVGIVGLILTILYNRREKHDKIVTNEAKEQTELEETFIGVSLKVDHISRRMIGYGASEENIIQAGHFKGNYEVEAELTITIQNESPNTLYAIEVSYIPNQYIQKYTLIDTRENKLQPIEGNKYVNFKLLIKNEYSDMYAQDVDKEFGSKVYMVGKGVSLLNGSKISIKYKDAKYKEHVKTQAFV